MNKTTMLLLTISAILIACSDEDKAASDSSSSKPQLTGEHVWKDQTDAMDKAREVEGLIQDAADKQRQTIDDQAQ